MQRPPIILVHGGAGRGAMTAAQQRVLSDALITSYAALAQGRSALDAVEGAIQMLEGCGLFNAGTGSRLQLDGVRRMDAALMEGRDLRAGAVASMQDVRHPIAAARLVLEHTPHVLLVGPPATTLAHTFRLERQAVPTAAQRAALQTDTRRAERRPGVQRLLRILGRANGERRRASHVGTVGAVAMDRQGTVATGASTGGITLMLPGRVGDTPLVGCGVYADDAGGAVSMTGIGEDIIRLAVAKEIVMLLAAGTAPLTATRRVLGKLVRRIDGAAGALVLRRDGRFAIRHTTPHMSAGYFHGRGKPVVRNRW